MKAKVREEVQNLLALDGEKVTRAQLSRADKADRRSAEQSRKRIRQSLRNERGGMKGRVL